MNAHQVFTVDLNVRFRDLDAMGHVNNAVFFTYFEEGRKAFFQTHFEKNGASDFLFILAHAACDYRKPITLKDAIRLCMWVGEMSTKRFDFIYRLIDGRDSNTIYASGRSVQVSFDYPNQKSIPLPHEAVKRLVPYQEESFKTDFQTP